MFRLLLTQLLFWICAKILNFSFVLKRKLFWFKFIVGILFCNLNCFDSEKFTCLILRPFKPAACLCLQTLGERKVFLPLDSMVISELIISESIWIFRIFFQKVPGSDQHRFGDLISIYLDYSKLHLSCRQNCNFCSLWMRFAR